MKRTNRPGHETTQDARPEAVALDRGEQTRTDQPAVRFERVNFGYGSELLFENFSLDIAPGEFFGVIGPNGAGKSTLLMLAAGLLAPHSGRVSVLGMDVVRTARRAIARRVAVVPQESFFAFDYGVEDVVMMGRNPYLDRLESPGPADWVRVREALEFVDATHLATKNINQVSAGEKQRVVLARALAQEPVVLLLDEAMSHLDIAHQRLILDILERLNQQGVTIVLLAHDLNLAALACSRVLLLRSGRLVACDLPERVITVELVRSVYGIEPIVTRHPETDRPQVMLPAIGKRTRIR